MTRRPGSPTRTAAAVGTLVATATAVAGTLVAAGPAPAAGAAAGPEPAAVSAEPRPGPVSRRSRVLVVRGHGYGHGHGMSQYGAQGAARRGKSYRQILNFYYPHTKRARAKGPLRVLITRDTSPKLTVKSRRGLTVRDLGGRGNGRAWRLPSRRGIDRWRIRPTRNNAARSSVQLHNRSGWQRWRIPGRRTVLRGDGQFAAHGRAIRLVLGRGNSDPYRGVLRSASPRGAARTRDTVNVVSLDSYIRGVLPAEMPTSWSRSALKAQAVAARTFAAYGRRANRHRYWHVCDTTACQVYYGVAVEDRRGNRAVRRSRHEIRTFHSRPALTQFSSSSGGWTSHGGHRYLPARKDRFDGWSGNANHTWKTRVSARVLQRRYPGLGRLRSVSVRKRDGNGQWGGRALRVRLAGRKGNVWVTGEELRYVAGLRSSWFRVRVTKRGNRPASAICEPVVSVLPETVAGGARSGPLPAAADALASDACARL